MLKSPSLSSTAHTNLKHLDSSQLQSIPEIWAIARARFGDTIALKDPHAKPEVVLTYAQLYEQIQLFAAGLQALGIKTGDRCFYIVGAISPNPSQIHTAQIVLDSCPLFGKFFPVIDL